MNWQHTASQLLLGGIQVSQHLKETRIFEDRWQSPIYKVNLLKHTVHNPIQEKLLTMVRLHSM